MNIEGCRAIVTGASSGIGLATAKALIVAGAGHIGCLSRTGRTPDELHGEYKRLSIPLSIYCLPVDVRDSRELRNTFEDFCNAADGIDVLVNCAGVLIDGALWTPKSRYSIDDWRTTLDTNLLGTFLCSQLAVEHMFKQRIRGVIVNMSSVSRRGRAGQVAYSASKGAVASMTASMAQELAAYKIRCVAIAPGLIDTPMGRQVPELYRDDICKATAARRIGRAEEIAEAVLFAIRNDFLNGCTLDIDGGFAG